MKTKIVCVKEKERYERKKHFVFLIEIARKTNYFCGGGGGSAITTHTKGI